MGHFISLLLVSATLLTAQVQSIDCGSLADRLFNGGAATSVITPGATGDLTLRYGTFSYRLPTDVGLQHVTLYLRETGTVGQRLFNVKANDQPLLSSFDLAAVVGLASTQRDFILWSNGELKLDFSYQLKSAIVSRIDWESLRVQLPNQQLESLFLSPLIPTEQLVINHTLAKTPLTGSYLEVGYQSSRVGQGVLTKQLVDSSKPREVILQLPEWRPFNNDKVEITYWTLE